MNTKDAANAIADRAEALADAVEATQTSKPDAAMNHEIAALLLCTDAHVYSHFDLSMIIDRNGNPVKIRAPWGGNQRGSLRPDFAVNTNLALALAEYVFDGWGWDIIKWPRGQGSPAVEGADFPTLKA